MAPMITPKALLKYMVAALPKGTHYPFRQGTIRKFMHQYPKSKFPCGINLHSWLYQQGQNNLRLFPGVQQRAVEVAEFIEGIRR